MNQSPDIILIPNSGVNRDVPDVNAAYCAAHWGIPVIDLNSFDAAFDPCILAGCERVAISTRTFAVQEARRLKAAILSARPAAVVGSLNGPVDVLCCYRYEVIEPAFSADLRFGDGMPVPDYSRFDSFPRWRAAWQSSERPYPLLSSLGCPFGCAFCMARRRPWRARSAGDCAQELTHAASVWGVKQFQILDDCFNLEQERVLEFCRLVEPLGLGWKCSNGLRADCFNTGQAAAMAAAGCEHITFGVETADEQLLAQIGKGETLAQVAEAVAAAKDAGIAVAGFFLIGLPGSSYTTDTASLAWARGQGMAPHFSYFVPSEHWQDGDKQFWGDDAAPLSDAYPHEQQRAVYRASRPGRGTGRRVVRNTLFNMIGRFWLILVGLALTPYILARLGPARYGVWALTSLLIGYVGLCDFGIRDAFTRFVADRHTRRETEGLNQIINTGLAFYAMLGLALLVGGGLAITPLLSILNIPPQLQPEAVDVFAGTIVIVAVAGIGSVTAAIPLGLQRMDISNRITIAVTLPQILGTVLLLEAGYGLRGLVVVRFMVIGLQAIINLWFGRRLCPGLRFGRLWVRMAAFRELFGFGAKRWVARLEDVLTFQTDKLLIAHFLGVPLVGLYEVGFQAVSRIAQLPGLLLSAVVPAAAELSACQDRDRLREFYEHGTKYMMLCSAPMLLFICIEAPLVLYAWLGVRDPEPVLVIRWLAMAFLVMSTTGMGSALAVGIGRPDFQMKAGGLQAVLNIGLSLILVRAIGFAGPVVATFFCVCLSSALFVTLLHRHLGLPYRLLLQRAMPPVLTGVAAVGPLLLLDYYVDWSEWHRLFVAARLALAAGLVGGCFLGLAALTRQIGPPERAYLRMTWKAFRG